MRVIGEGGELWRVEVVLRVREPDDRDVARLIEAVSAVAVDSDEEPTAPGDVDRSWSYDIQPPEGGVGVACWVRSDDVGGAAHAGWTVVSDAAAAVLGASAPLWDLRVIPRAAILEAPDTGTQLRR